MEDVGALNRDRETTLRLFQNVFNEQTGETAVILENLRSAANVLRGQYRQTLRQLKDAKRGIRIHGSLIDVDEHLSIGKEGTGMSEASLQGQLQKAVGGFSAAKDDL